MEKAIFAGGCFWGMEELFRNLDGVVDTTVGYTGGSEPKPTYERHTGHAEAIEITYDPARITYTRLLEYLFQIHDPSTKNRQGNDVGTSYRSAVFTLDEGQKRAAEEVIARVNASGRWPGKVATEVSAAPVFHPAEAYHQDYLQRYPNGYTCHFVRPNWKL